MLHLITSTSFGILILYFFKILLVSFGALTITPKVFLKISLREDSQDGRIGEISGSLLPTGTSRIHLQVKQFTWNLLNTSR